MNAIAPSMKTHFSLALAALLGAAGPEVLAATKPASRTAPTSAALSKAPVTQESEPRITSRWGDGRTWERTVTHTFDDGSVRVVTNRWTELATGLHYRHDGQWRESSTEIVITPEGAEAVQGPHQVRFAGNINTLGSLAVTTRDARTLRSHVVGLAYTDLATGDSVLIAKVQDSVGQLFPPNQIVYANAFAGLAADLRYTYTRDGVEQDVVLRASPPPPEDYGLNNATTALEVWTEFVEAPEPERTARTRGDMSDEDIGFGQMRLGRGAAFALGSRHTRLGATPVGKTWLPANGKRYLIESVRHPAVAPELRKLPAAPKAPGGRTGERAALLRNLGVGRAEKKQPVKMALNREQFHREPGVVVDFILLNTGYTDFTFCNDTTYLISDFVGLDGTTTFEGGTVIKVATTGGIYASINADVVWKADRYRPVIVTSQNDNTVGENVSAPSTPMKCFAGLVFYSPPPPIEHVRVSHAEYGLATLVPATVRDAQFTHCDLALYTDLSTLEIDNALFYNVGRAFSGWYFTNIVRHVTVHRAAQLSEDLYGDQANSTLILTNSLLVNVTNSGSVTTTTNHTVTTTGDVFQQVGAGHHYLADPSPYRDSGTTNLPATTRALLSQRTTYPPLVIATTNGHYGVSQTWFPRAHRDADQPDLGYHYTPLDYAISFLYLTNATIQVEPGTAVASFGPTNTWVYGLALSHGAKLLATGQADRKVTFTDYATVQEMASDEWSAPLAALIMGWWSTTGSPELRARFTDFTVLAGGPGPLYGYEHSAPWHLTDCQFHGLGPYGWMIQTYFTNVLFNRAYTEIYGDGACVSQYRNCTFHAGTYYAYYDPTNSGVMTDTLFAGTTIWANPTNSHIAYTTNGADRLEMTNATDVILTSLTFQRGPLGWFYIPTNSALINAGSRIATNAGLYHFTMLTNNVKETNTTVDIGFHHVATDGNGTPLDHDTDGVPDYWEDWNGNGSHDTGEINWREDDTDGDGVSDGLEILQGRNPLGGTTNDINNLINLRVFTPLK